MAGYTYGDREGLSAEDALMLIVSDLQERGLMMVLPEDGGPHTDGFAGVPFGQGGLDALVEYDYER